MSAPRPHPFLGFYRRLLGLYPASFRARFGPDLLASVDDRLRDAPSPRRPAGLRVALDLALDLVLAAARERVAPGDPMTSSRFWSLWVLASTLGWPLGFAVGYPFDTPEWIPLGGVLPAALHALLLAHRFDTVAWLLRWGWAFPLGWGLGLAAMLPLPWSTYAEPRLEALALGLLLATLVGVGLLQPLAVRKLGYPGWSWLLAPVTGVLLAGLVGTSTSALLVQNGLWAPPSSAVGWAVAHFFGFALFGAIHGGITALFLRAGAPRVATGSPHPR